MNGDGPPDDSPAEAARRRRDEARAARDAANTSAAEMREIAKRLNADADAVEEQAEGDLNIALASADDLEGT